MGLDYYAILNIDRRSPSHEIALAYRKYATATHPHRQAYPMHPENPPEGCPGSIRHLPAMPNKEFWQCVNEAYDVLIDPLHREVFDRFGEEGLKGGTPTPNGYVQPYVYHGDYMKTYETAMGSASPYVDLIDAVTDPPPLYTVNGQRGVRVQCPPVEIALHLSLKEVFYGGIKKKKIYRQEFVDESRTATEMRERVLVIPIRPGIATGSRITFAGEGDRAPTRRPADIVFVVHDQPHPIYRRDGVHLRRSHSVDLMTSLSGFVIEVMTVDDRRFLVPIADMVSPGYVKCIQNEGLPDENDPSTKGNLYIEFKVNFPTELNKECREAIAIVLKAAPCLHK